MFHNFAVLVRKQQSAKEQSFERKAEDGSNIDRTPWTNLMTPGSEFHRQWNLGGSPRSNAIVVTSGTGTGKSSRFTGALYELRNIFKSRLQPYFKMLILVPREVLLFNFKVDGTECFTSSRPISGNFYFAQKLSVGTSIDTHPSVLYYIATYGHFVERYDSDLALQSIVKDSIVMFDEFHEMDMAMMASFDVMNKNGPVYNKLILSSATPQTIPQIQSTVFNSGLPDRFKRTFIKHPATVVNILDWVSTLPEYKEYLDSDSKIIVRHPFLKDFPAIRDGLENGVPKHAVYELSGDNSRDPIPNDKLVLASNVINAGIDLPHRRALIDEGMTIGNDRNVMKRTQTSPLEFQQISGRIGRSSSGIYVYNPQAGTGPILRPYSSIHLFTFKTPTDYLSVPQLISQLPDDQAVLRVAPFIRFEPDTVTLYTRPERRLLLLVILLYANNVDEQQLFLQYSQLLLGTDKKELNYYYRILDKDGADWSACQKLLAHPISTHISRLLGINNGISITILKNRHYNRSNISLVLKGEDPVKAEFYINTVQYKNFNIGPWTSQSITIPQHGVSSSIPQINLLQTIMKDENKVKALTRCPSDQFQRRLTSMIAKLNKTCLKSAETVTARYTECFQIDPKISPRNQRRLERLRDFNTKKLYLQKVNEHVMVYDQVQYLSLKRPDEQERSEMIEGPGEFAGLNPKIHQNSINSSSTWLSGQRRAGGFNPGLAEAPI